MPTQTDHTTAIRASRVIETDVFLQNGDKFGEIADVVLDKTSDRIMFAVVNRDGALTATANFYSVDWSDLDYREDMDGYVLPYGPEKFDGEPSVSAIDDFIENDGAKAA